MSPERAQPTSTGPENDGIGPRLGFGADEQRWTSVRRRATLTVLGRSARRPAAPCEADAAAHELGFDDVNPREGCAAERIEGGRPLPARLAGAVIALGNFDGFHLGHQAVVGRAVEIARARGVAAIVATFDPHPVRHFRPDGDPFRLTSLDQRQHILGRAGVNALMVCAFDGALARLTPEAFVDGWLTGAGGIVTGENYAFGCGRSGDIHLLGRLATERGMSCEAAEAITRDGETVSSSRIRELLRKGDCEAAARLLTRPFAVQGHSAPRPDGSIVLDLGDYLHPRDGFYSVRVRTPSNRPIEGIAHIASRTPRSLGRMRICPTLAGVRLPTGCIDVELTRLVCEAGFSRRARALQRSMSPERQGA